MDSKPLVTITGISGFLGSQVCLYFLKSGQFKVRGTVRSKTNAKRIEPLKKAFGDLFNELELAEADLMDKNSLIKACEGSEFIVHTASPFPLKQPKKADELIKPAVEGTLAIMEAAKINKVKRVVITSSVVAIYSTHKPKTYYDHNSWSEEGAGNFYDQSKTKAERAAWDYLEQLPSDEKFEISTINPGLIIGPSLVEGQFSSADVVKMFLMREIPFCPKTKMPIADVRDVAEAHFKALTIPDAAGKRFVMVAESVWMKQVALGLHEKYGGQYKIPIGDMPKCVAWAGHFFKDDLATLWRVWNVDYKVDASQTREVLGINFTEPKKSFQDMAESLIDSGYIPDKRTK